jgi:putative ABC transport system permease protein
MIGLSVAGLRERWPLFLGAILSVAVGVALLASAMMVAVSATPPDVGDLPLQEAAAVREAFDGVATVMIISAMLAGFLTVFIVATTFSFTVAERRRDIALLRLLGAGRAQVRLVLVGESVLLGMIGAVVGFVLTGPAVDAQMWLLRRAHFVPDGFRLTEPAWPAWAACGIGVAIAMMGVLAASRRAAAVPPLEAIRGASAARRVMTAGRWISGLAMLALTVVQIVAASLVGLVVALALALGVAVTGAVAMSLLAPAFVPLASWFFGLPMRSSTLGGLAHANAREGIQRSASTAAPVILLMALVISITGALAATTQATAIEERTNTDADFIVSATGNQIAEIATVPGVAASSPELVVPLSVDLPIRDGSETTTERYLDGIVVVDPAGYAKIHPARPVAGRFSDLTGKAIAVMERPTDGVRFKLGDHAALQVGAAKVNVRIAVILPERLSTRQQVLIPRGLIPPAEQAPAPADVIVKAAPDHGAETVADAAQRYGKVTNVDTWVKANADALQRTNNATLTVLLALAALYTVMAVINAIVIAGTGRRREHALARLSGLTRSQVVATTALEGLIVTVTGLTLGALVVTSALTGIAMAARRSVDTAIVEVPWPLVGATVAGTLALATFVSAAVSSLVTRTRPIVLAAARE